MPGKPINLFVVSRLLLAGLTWPEIQTITGWARSTVQWHAERIGYKLPQPNETAFSSAAHVAKLIVDAANQGFSQRQCMAVLRMPQRLIRKYWPQGVPATPAAPDMEALATLMINSGQTIAAVRKETHLTKSQLERVRASLRKPGPKA